MYIIICVIREMFFISFTSLGIWRIPSLRDVYVFIAFLESFFPLTPFNFLSFIIGFSR